MIGDKALSETVRVYVWEWPVRVSHWLIAGTIAVLSATGLYIANPSLMTTGVVNQRSLMRLYVSIAAVISSLWIPTATRMIMCCGRSAIFPFIFRRYERSSVLKPK